MMDQKKEEQTDDKQILYENKSEEKLVR